MGRIRLTGATSGYTELRAASTAGNNTITLPTTNGGEVVVSDSSGNVNIDSGTFYVDAVNNRVGVGSNAPSYLLDLLGSAPRIRVKDSSTGAAFHHFENNSGNFYLGIDNSTGGSLSAGNYARVLWSQGAYPLVFATNDTQRAQVDSSGRLLVGTSSPRSWSGVTSNIQLEGTDFNASSISQTLNSNNDNGAYLALNKSRGTSNGSQTVVQSGDQVGAIYFNGADGSSLRQAARIEAIVDGTPGAADMPGRLVFSTTADGAGVSTERARITAAGALKAASGGAAYIGTGSGYDAVHELVTNNNGYEALIVTNRNSSSPLGVQIFYATDINNTASLFLGCYGSSTLRAGFRSNGGLANYQANNVNLSDRNAKKDISPAAGTWDCIKEWEIVNYRYKDQPDDADLNLGVIAQQVAESCPEVITVFEEAKDDQPEKLGVKEQQMYWMAIKALQEAQVRIEALEAEVAALKAQ